MIVVSTKNFYIEVPVLKARIDLPLVVFGAVALILNVKDPYYDQIIHTFDLLEKYQVKYIVNTVVNKRNASLDDVKSLVDFFQGKKYLTKWGMNSAKCSMYIGNSYHTYKAPVEKVREIE